MQRDDFAVRSFPGLDTIGLSDTAASLRVAIVTEEIIGPVRNGGIASTYYHLAKGLAARGHEVHVLFLKGPTVQDETPEYWAERYAEFGVTLHYLEMPIEPLWGVAASWQRRYAAAYEWLRDQEPFDVVHTSEWRGGLVYALMAKRLGLAFRDTLFLVKTSSPYIWNRHYQMEPISQLDLVAACYAEQKCVELADIVVGGSAHLISFMERIGYRLPEPNVFVQPNIVDFSNVPVVDRRPGPRREHGDVVRTRDLVFFGRLEARKGLELFCNAVDLLHERGEIPDSVTFLGKWGANLPAQGGVSPEAFVNEKAQTWDCPVRAVTDRNQPEALSYLCQQDVIAVMPSLIENSSMAIYETLEQRVPFVATAVGGSAELIAPEDHAACLVEPTSQAVADRLEEVLREGQVIARPRFANDANLRAWYGFHAHVGDLIATQGRPRAIAQLTAAVERPVTPVRTISHVTLMRRGESVEALVKAIHEEPPDELVVGFTETSARREIEHRRELLDELPTDVTVVNCLGMTSGDALHRLAETQRCDAMVVADGLKVLPRLGFFQTARIGLSHRPDALLTTFFAAEDGTIGMPLGGDVASQALTSRAYGPETVAMRTETYAEVGRFEPYDARRGIVHEHVTRAAESGHDLLVFPESLVEWPTAVADSRAFQSDPLYAYLKAKPLIDGSPLAQRKVMLAALRAGGGGAGVAETLLREPSADEAETQWLMPATWDPENVHAAQNRRLIVALDAKRDEIWLYARGPGERRLSLRGEDLPTELLVTEGVEGEDLVTVSLFRVPGTWVPGTSYPLLWGVYDGQEKLRNLFLRLNKIGASTFALSGRTPVLSVRALSEILERRARTWPEPVAAAPAEPQPDLTEEYVSRAVAGARRFVQGLGGLDALQVTRCSEVLLAEPPPRMPPPIEPRSGLSSPHAHEGWLAGEWLGGWAWDREDRGRILHVRLMCGDEPLMMVAAGQVDRSLNDVPGRGGHAFRIPVLPELFEAGRLRADRLHLEIWEDGSTVFRGELYVDRSDAPMLRRLRYPDPRIPRPREPADDQGSEQTGSRRSVTYWRTRWANRLRNRW